VPRGAGERVTKAAELAELVTGSGAAAALNAVLSKARDCAGVQGVARVMAMVSAPSARMYGFMDVFRS